MVHKCIDFFLNNSAEINLHKSKGKSNQDYQWKCFYERGITQHRPMYECMHVCMNVSLFVRRSTCLPANLSVRPAICTSVCVSVSVCLSVCLSACLPVYLSLVYLSFVYLSLAFLSVYLSVYQFINYSVHRSIYPYVCLYFDL